MSGRHSRSHLGRIGILALLVCLIGPLIAGPAPAAAKSTTTIRQHFEYDLEDDSSGTAVTVHFSCDEVRVSSAAKALETIVCQTSDRSHTRPVVFSPTHLFSGYPWFSDFTGQPADDFRFVGTPSGILAGWAMYRLS